ncbi:MAG: hypothetical protein A2X18_12120 [Bacteroidetes bacterium GWF2_40_14]|nr:MAG: hypothetical protein A2X18_12120 [Bacteroidetes bacterium GWF2_40_14]
MITRMNKYSMIIYHADLSSFLERLQNLGMVDIKRENRAVDSHSKELYEQTHRYRQIIKKLGVVRESIADKTKIDLSLVDKRKTAEELLEAAEECFNNGSLWEQELQNADRERTEAFEWGEYNREDIEKIKMLGYDMHFYSTSDKRFNQEWSSVYLIHKLNQSKGKTYFVILTPVGEDFKFDIPESKFPQTSFNLLDIKIDALQKNIESNNRRVEALTHFIELLDKRSIEVGGELDLYLANTSSQKEAEGTIAVLTGYAPINENRVVADFLDNEGVYYLSKEAVDEDNPPIKLKNNFFAKLYEPIGELYMLPKYGELDLTPYFAPFYMLFFGFCLGDMGYGLVLLVGAGLAKFKMPKMKSYLTLVQLLGLGAVIMASLSGTFFGAKLAEILPLTDSAKALFFTDLKMFWFAIIFGLVHIITARIITAIDSMIRKGWQYGMSNIGWTIVIIWASLAYAGTMVPELVLPPFAKFIGFFGALLILLFSSVEGNFFIRILKGTVSFYDITGVFGDMLSYIRLFGLATSGGILGMVVNSVAMGMLGLPYVGWLFAGLFLLIGHTAVLALSCLGAFVHPMRLTFVEFYKNAGFTGGGKAFRPLSK